MAKQTINIADKTTLDEVNNKLSSITGNVEFLDDGVVKGDNCVIAGRYIKDSTTNVSDKHIINYNNNLYAVVENKMYKFDGERFVFHTLLPVASLKVWTVHNGEIHGLSSSYYHIKYDGIKWSTVGYTSALASPLGYASCMGFVSYNGKLYFIAKNASDSGSYADRLWYYIWDGSTWTEVFANSASVGTSYFPYGRDGSYATNSLKGFIVYKGYIYYYTQIYENSDHIKKLYRFNGSSSTLVYSPLTDYMNSTIVYNDKIWSISSNVLTSYDGNSFTTYGKSSYDEVSSDSVMSYYGNELILLYYSTAYSKFDPATNKFTNYGLSSNLTYESCRPKYGPCAVECDDGIYFVPYNSSGTSKFYHVSKDGILSSAPSLPNTFDFTSSKLVYTGTYLFYVYSKYIYVLNSTSWKLIYTADNYISMNTVVYQNENLYFATDSMLYECSYDGSTVTVIEKIHVPYASDISLFSLDNKIYHQKGSCYYDGNDWVECEIPPSISDTSKELIECNGFLHDIRTYKYGVSSSGSDNKTHYVYDKYFNKYEMDNIPITGNYGTPCKLGDKIALLYNDKCYEIDTEIVYAKKAILEAGTIIVFQDDKKHLVKPLLNCEKIPDGNLKVLETGLVRFGSLYISEIGTINIQKS